MKIIKMLCCFCFLFFAMAVQGDTVFLKNGKVFDAEKVWKEDGMVKCTRFGATVGYPGEAVLKIVRAGNTKKNSDQTIGSPEQMTAEPDPEIRLSRKNLEEFLDESTGPSPGNNLKKRSETPVSENVKNVFLEDITKGKNREPRVSFTAASSKREVSIQSLLDEIGKIDPKWVLLFFFSPPILVFFMSKIHARGRGRKFPWNYLYSFFVYIVAIPGMLAGVLTAYTVFFIHQSLLRVNAFIYFLPLFSMIITLVIIGKNVPWKYLPGVDRLYALMIILVLSFGITLGIYKTRIFLFFGGSVKTLLLIALACFVVLKISTYVLFGKSGKKYY